MSGDLYWLPVVDCDDLPEHLVWPGNDYGDTTTRWWVTNDAETATTCHLVEFLGGASIERDDDR